MRAKYTRSLGFVLSGLLSSCAVGGANGGAGGSETELDAGAGSVEQPSSDGSPQPAQFEASRVKIDPALWSRVGTELAAGRGQSLIVELAVTDADRAALLGARQRYGERAENTTRSLGRGVRLVQSFDRLPFALVQVDSSAAAERLLAHAGVTHVWENLEFRPQTDAGFSYIGQTELAEEFGYDPDADDDLVEHLGSYDREGLAARVGIALLDGRVNPAHAAVGCTAVGAPANTCRLVGYRDVAGSLEPYSNHATTMAGILRRAAPAANLYNVDVTSGDTASTVGLLAGLNHVLENLSSDGATAGRYYKFDESSGLASPPTGAGTAVAWTGTPTRVSGFDGAALRCDGDDVGALANSVSADFSIAFWMRTSQTGGTGSQWNQGAGIVDGALASSTADFGVSLLGDRIAFGTGGATDTTVVSSASVNGGAWTHVVVTRKRGASTSALKVYIDGVLSGSATSSSIAALTGSANLSVCGLLAGGGAFVGELDELRFYTSELSAADITKLAAPDPTFGVSVVSMSLGTTTTYADVASCRAAAGSIETAVSLLHTAGIVTVAAAGNSGSSTGLSAPACLPNVLSVGSLQGKVTSTSSTLATSATTSCTQAAGGADSVLCNGNSNAELDLFAPGFAVDVDAVASKVCAGGAVPGASCTSDGTCEGGVCTLTDSVCVGGAFAGAACIDPLTCDTGTCTATLPAQSGTSVAAAHAAAGLAMLYAAHRNDAEPETVARAAARLGAGPLVLDARNGVRVPRLSLPASVGDCLGAIATPSALAVDVTGATRDVTIEVEAGCEANIDTQAAPWISVTNPSERVVRLVVSDNFGQAARTGTIWAFGAAVAVSQDADPSPPVTTSFSAQGTGGDFPSLAGHTASTNVTLQIAGTDVTGIASMCVVNDEDAAPPAACAGGSWQTFASSRSWSLLPGDDGIRYAHVWLRDTEGHVNEATTLSILLDTVDPTTGSLAAPERVTEPVALRLVPSGMSDAALTTFKVAYRADIYSPGQRCIPSPGVTLLDMGTQTPFVIGGLVSGTTYTFRVCAVDSAGNAAPGAVASGVASNDLEAPVGAVFAPGAGQLGIGFVDDANSAIDYRDDVSELIWSSAAKLRLVATDNRGVAAYCLSAAPACTGWTAVTPSASFELAALPVTLSGDGIKTYYVKFRDAFGNESVQYSTSARLDTTAPSPGTLTAVRGLNKVTLTLTGASDVGTMVTAVIVARSTTAPGPSSCASGDVTVLPVSGSVFTLVDGALDESTPTVPETQNAIVPGTTYFYRVCARDVAGLTSAGALASATPTNDTEPPVGTLAIQGTAIGSSVLPGYTGSASVTIEPSVTDETAPSVSNPAPLEMCVSTSALDTTPTCPDTVTTGLVNNGWQPATSTGVTLATGDGLKTFHYKFRDGAMSPRNISAVQSVSVRLDTTAPRAGTVTASSLANFKATLLFSGFSDANGLTYSVLRGGCMGTLLSSAATSPFVVPAESPALTTATARTYCVVATDGAGRSASASATTTLRAETAAPVLGTPTLLATCTSATKCTSVTKAGVVQKWTSDRNPAVTLTVSDENLSGGALCYAGSNSAGSCTNALWQNLTDLTVLSPGLDVARSVPKPTTAFPTGEAKRTVYVFARDGMGNVTAAGKEASIYVDTLGPAGGALSPAALSTTSISVKWTKPTDAGVGLPASSIYMLCMAKGSTAAAAATQPSCNAAFTGCASGTKLTVSSSAAASSFAHTGLVKNTYYSYALCRRDALGNFTTLRKSVKTRAQ